MMQACYAVAELAHVKENMREHYDVAEVRLLTCRGFHQRLCLSVANLTLKPGNLFCSGDRN